MPLAKRPCLQCKEKHVKCDEARPKCRRCQARNLTCTRPAKKTVFRNASTAPFNNDQRWVSGGIKEFSLDSCVGDESLQRSTGALLGHGHTVSAPPALGAATAFSDTSSLNSAPIFDESAHDRSSKGKDAAPAAHGYRSQQWQAPLSEDSPGSTTHSDLSARNQDLASQPFGRGHETADKSPLSPASHVPLYRTGETPGFPLTDPQEACLLRYFVEDLSHWFDLCDEKRHFQLIVPIRARHHPPLLNAIFALAARHLTRLPKFKTPQGILYQGQLLPNLTSHDAVEYTLKCIPALRNFHNIQDDERLENIIATAVILRQLEEIDDEDDAEDGDGATDAGSTDSRSKRQPNFLAVIDAVLRSAPSQALFGRRPLMQAAYWMAVRQEIFHSFTRRHPPQMVIEPEYGLGASKANQIVLHTAQVAKWRWSDGSEREWLRLQKQGEQLEEEALREFQPFFRRQADRSNGEIFPTIWYSSALEVTSIQLTIIAKMVLMAENPFLGGQSTTRARWREIENEVRQMILDLCGISLCHPACPPALVHAAFGMELYGDFFTDHYERKALRGVVEKFRDARAWPDKKLSSMFQ